MNIYFLMLIAILTVPFFLIVLQYNKMKNAHEIEISKLNAIIVELLTVQSQQNGAIKLSDDLKIKLQDSRVEIDKKLLNLQNELIEKLVDNNLV